MNIICLLTSQLVLGYRTELWSQAEEETHPHRQHDASGIS